MKNMEWNKIPATATVVDLGKAYVAIVKRTRYGVFWSSTAARDAQAWLGRRAKKDAAKSKGK